jgi:hypothetical protein
MKEGVKMEKTLDLNFDKSIINTYIIDFVLLIFIYLAPVLSHLFVFPVYYLDPMRIAIVFGLLFTSKKNVIILALTLPIFSFIISTHPQIYKSFLLTAELLMNIGLFFWLLKKLENVFTSFLLSVIISKAIYYSAKFAFIRIDLINDSLFSTPFYFQILVAVILSGVLYWKFKTNKLRSV